MPKTRLILGIGALAVLVAAVLLIANRREAVEAGPMDVVPKDARFVVEAHDVGLLLQGAQDAAKRLGIGALAAGARRSVSMQLGFDAFDPAELKQRGIRTDGSLVAFGFSESGIPLAALEVTDRAAFEKALITLLEGRVAAKRAPAASVSGIPVERLVDPQERLVLAWGYRGSVVVMSSGAGAEDRVAVAVSHREGTSIRDRPDYQRARQEVGEGLGLFAWGLGKDAARVDRRLRRLAERLTAAALGLEANASALRARGFADLDATALTGLQPLRRQPKAEPLLRDLDPDAVLVARLTLDPVRAWAVAADAGLPRQLDELSAQLLARGIKLREELLPLVAGDLVADLRPMPAANLAEMASLDIRRTNPFNYVRMTALVPLTDAKKAAEMLPKLAESLSPVLRAAVEEEEIAGVRAWTVRYHLGRGMSFGVVGDVLLVSGGEGAFADAVARITGDARGLADQAAPGSLGRLATEGSLALHVPVVRLLEEVAALDASSLGGGLTGMTLEIALRRLRQTLSRLQSVDLSVGVAESGLSGGLDVAFRATEAEAAEK